MAHSPKVPTVPPALSASARLPSTADTARVAVPPGVPGTDDPPGSPRSVFVPTLPPPPTQVTEQKHVLLHRSSSMRFPTVWPSTLELSSRDIESVAQSPLFGDGVARSLQTSVPIPCPSRIRKRTKRTSSTSPQCHCTAAAVARAEAAPHAAAPLGRPAPDIRAQQRRDPGHHAHPAPRVSGPPHPQQRARHRSRNHQSSDPATGSRGAVDPSLRQGPQPARQRRGQQPPPAPPPL